MRWTAGGCALIEHWIGAVSGEGTALFFHEQGRWQFRYVNSDGRTLALSGEARGDQIVLAGRHVDLAGRPGEHWMRLAAEGTDVRQTWYFRPDATGRWELVLDAIQRRQPPAG